MEPVEINAGAYYLRALRADDRIDDRPAVLAGFTDPETARWIPEYQVHTLAEAGEYIAVRGREWRDGQRCSWAVAEPTTGTMLAEVGLKNLRWDSDIGDIGDIGGTADVACWTHPAHRGRGIAAHAVAAALRFGFGALGLTTIGYWYADGNAASARVAAKCGFDTQRLRLPGAAEVDGEQRDLLCLTICAPATPSLKQRHAHDR
jgi:RimJ/RimL family protein N-acetyltransferase